jgi:hypothetical protein
VSIEITEIIWICNVMGFFFKFGKQIEENIGFLCKVTLVFFSGYHDIPWAFQALLKLEKKLYSRHHELVDSTQMTNDLRLF